MGIKKEWNSLLRKLILGVIGWLVVSTLVVNALFSYFNYYVSKEEQKIYYDIRSSVSGGKEIKKISSYTLGS